MMLELRGPLIRNARVQVAFRMLYGCLELRSGEGLDWRIQTSNADASMRLARAIEARPFFDGAR